MKRAAHALLIAALVAAASFVPTTTASGELIEAIDAGVETASLLAEIAPAGNFGVFAVTATLSGPTTATVNITDSVGGGTVEPSLSILDACNGTQQVDAAGTTLTCSVTLGPANPSATIHVAVRSGLGAEQVFNHATVTMEGDDTLVGIDADDSNNQASATVPVTAGSTSAGFVPEGGSLTYEANGQTHVLTVIDARGPGGGALVTMSDPGLMTCGATACQGVRIVFAHGEDGGFYEAATEIDSTGPHDPCRGLGSTTCTDLFWRKSPADTMVAMPACGTQGPAEPCLQQKYKAGGAIHYVTEMDTDDPDIGMPGVPVTDTL